MDETGMSEADKIEFVDDVLRTWGEEAAQELARPIHEACSLMERAERGRD